MKSIIIYYSYSGNTRKVADILCERLKQKGEVEIIDLQARDESRAFLGQCQRAFRHVKANIATVNFDLSGYDLVCFGTPVWAFGPAPAMNTYLEKCFGLGGKRIILFVTYGGGLGKVRCLDYMQGILSKKGAIEFHRFLIQQFRVKDRDFVLGQIKETMRL